MSFRLTEACRQYLVEDGLALLTALNNSQPPDVRGLEKYKIIEKIALMATMFTVLDDTLKRGRTQSSSLLSDLAASQSRLCMRFESEETSSRRAKAEKPRQLKRCFISFNLLAGGAVVFELYVIWL